MLAIIINSASYDRVSYALTVATMAAAHGKEVHVLFTYGAVLRLLRGKADEVGEETDAWIRERVKQGLTNGSISKVSDTLAHLKSFGGKLYACSASLVFHRIHREELIEAVDEVCGISTFLEKTETASMLYV